MNWRHIIWFLAVWMILIFLFRGFEPAQSTQEISYTDFKKNVGRGGGIFGFAKSKARLFDKKSSKIRYNDVAGLDNAKKELQ